MSSAAASSHSNASHADTNNNTDLTDNSSLSSHATSDLDGWRAELQRLASESSTWREWNVSNLYDGEVDIPAEVMIRVKDKIQKRVSLSDLRDELAQHESMLEQVRAEDETLTHVTADIVSLDQLSDQVSSLVSDLTAGRDHVTQQESFLRQLDSMSRDTQALTLDQHSVQKADQLLQGLKLADDLGKKQKKKK